MRILVRGDGPGAYLLGCLAVSESHHVTIDASGRRNRLDLGVYFDASQRKTLARRLPALGAILDKCGRVWSHNEIRRAREAVRVAIRPMTAISDRLLTVELRAAAEAAGCRSASVPQRQETQFDVVVVADPDFGEPAVNAPANVDITTGPTEYLVGFVPIALANSIVSFRERMNVWFQLTMLPGEPERTLAIIEKAAGAPRPSSMDAIFSDEFQGQSLKLVMDWRQSSFFHVKRRLQDRRVLMGRAAARGHYGLLADIRIELEDAVALSNSLRASERDDDRLLDYQRRRSAVGNRFLLTSKLASDWCNNLGIYCGQTSSQFTFNHLTRHYRISYEDIKAQDPILVTRVERELSPLRNDADPIPPMFNSFQLREMQLPNRIVFSPMCMRQGTRDAAPTDFHLVHLGSRAMGGAGLVFAEMTAVEPSARISLNCVGLYHDDHVAAWRRVTDFVHMHSDAKIAMQLGHAGRKGSTRPTPDAWSVPLEEDGWELLSASAIPYTARSAIPRAANQKDMDNVLAAYVDATRRAVAADFDMVEIHMAHGYLLSSFISPLTNRREDMFGGAIENRMRYPMQVFEAVRRAWPAERPISVRISASDWLPDGITIEDVVALARMLKAAGCDIMTVSTGNTTSGSGDTKKSSTGNWAPEGRLYQVPFSDRVRNEVGMPTIAVGSITSWGDANVVIAAGRADLCAIARGHLFDPYFVRHAAYAQSYDMKWHSSYRSAAEHKPRGPSFMRATE